jgi:ATP-dependent DNA helicase RecG
MNIECKESEIIEFKQSLATIDDAIKTISSMLNKHHRGTIYFGIKDDGEIIGIILTDKNKRDIVEKIKTKIKPIIYPSIEEIKINNKTICKISFEAYDIPYSFEGRFYIRVGTTTSQMEISAIKELISKDISLEMEKRDSLISLNNLDTDAFTSYKNLINDKYKKFSDVKILEKLELTNGKNFNNAGKLLFSNSSSINLRMAMK